VKATHNIQHTDQNVHHFLIFIPYLNFEEILCFT